MILVTGGAGFIGSNLQAALVRRGHETVVADWLGSGAK
jgi:ADP-L-glycero-D-manno-heptose 6-epimerase